jgi:serine/threonine protein kinase/Flp pilus assembly protein TadD
MNADPDPAKAIFLEAVERHAPEQWASFLDRACAGQPELRRRVEVLLEAHRQVGTLEHGDLAEGANSRPAAAVDLPTTEAAGAVIGPYKLIEQLGEGGMGSVWMAQQTEPVKRLVAVKLIKAGMDSKQVIARFEAERQALALMDHPNIARVLDAGTTDAGRPYFVMDLVKGVPITTYCDNHHLTPRQRLELFIPVCQAVQHAHQKGIIHRDLKPSNVLVALYDGKPVPKVIDFGVAKAAGQQLTDKTLVTGFGAIVGTLEYMSPEQAEINQLDIDTRSDIYSLGVIVYELLAGSPPFSRKELEKAGMLEMLRVIREQEPSKPSTKLSLSDALPTLSANRGTEPAKLTKLLRGELDWIVMRALEKNRNRRYETANGFAMDVQRYLADEPVQACPPSSWYRLRKFARRNRLGLAAAASMLLFIVSLGAVVGWAVRDRDAREREAANEQKAREAALESEVNRNLDEGEALIEQERWAEAVAAGQRTKDLLASAGHRETPTRLQELQKDLAFVQRLEDIYAQPKTDAFFTGHEQDAAYAKAFADCGIDVTALPIAETAERVRARRIRKELVRGLDFWSLARRYANKGARPDWKQLLEIAKAADRDVWRNQLRDALKAEDQKALLELAAFADVRRLPPQTLVLLGRTLADVGAAEQAAELLSRAHRIYPGDLWINDTLGSIYLDRLGQPDKAVSYYTAALVVRPGNPYLMSQVGRAQLWWLRDAGEGLAVFDKAIELRPDLSFLWRERGKAYIGLGLWDLAGPDFDRAFGLREPSDAQDFYEHALLRLYLGDRKGYDQICTRMLERFAQSPDNRVAFLIADTCTVGPNPIADTAQLLRFAERAVAEFRSAWHLNAVGVVHYRAGNYEKAIKAIRDSLAVDPDWCKSWNYAYLAMSHHRLGQVELAREELMEAGQALNKLLELKLSAGALVMWSPKPWWHVLESQMHYREAMELINGSGPPENPRLWILRGQGLLMALKREKEALACYLKAWQLDPNSDRIQHVMWHVHPPGPDGISHSFEEPVELNKLAWRLATRVAKYPFNPRKALEYAEQAVKADPKQGAFQTTLGVARYGTGDWAGAISALQEALRCFEGEKDFQIGVGRSLFFLSMAQQKAGRGPEARQTYERALAWVKTNRQVLDKSAWAIDEMRRFQTETEEVLGEKAKK